MHRSRSIAATVALLFTMLWAPLGQTEFLVEHWMKVGTFAAPFLLLGALAFAPEPGEGRFLAEPRTAAVALLLAYIAHQFEEHWVDVTGATYAFYAQTNEMLLGKLGAGPGAEYPLTREAIFVINTTLVWLVGALAIWRAPRFVFPTLAMASITVVNAVVHIAAGALSGAYNPGLLTAFVVFLPLGLAVYRAALATGTATRRTVAVSLVWAVLGHVLMVGGLLAANWFHAISQSAYFVALGVWSALPSLLERQLDARREP
ncbi:MAG: HXXEE domain-containing protein [Planctomycetota bacterium]